jgi:uncharacterized membrane protein
MTTTIHNSIDIDATPEQVWAVLADLDGLATFDPFVETSTLLGDKRECLGAQRKCTVKPKNWFDEEITVWEPHRRLQFSIIDCNLPTRSLTHTYTLEPSASGTHVAQVMRYEMKLGLVGQALNRLIIRRKSDQQIKGFFAGLKARVEADAAAQVVLTSHPQGDAAGPPEERSSR